MYKKSKICALLGGNLRLTIKTKSVRRDGRKLFNRYWISTNVKIKRKRPRLKKSLINLLGRRSHLINLLEKKKR